ncbi:alpha/beta hydrolase fold domain-containing protein [Rubritalea spongiae]|uniref:Alpha/beta hydrolase fold domain-containing protein n=1 Tax=Rubritalea spongiae TaxID=430797 RepID=A0ABW5DYI4_9BACT
MKKFLQLTLLLVSSVLAETLPPLVDGRAPQNHEELWAGFDPSAEPLDVEVLHEWEEGGVILKVIRYRVGIFKGKKAMMAAVYAYPKGGKNLPGLVNIHGGGQFADYRGPLTNAKRGYATISLAWAGRISAPDYTVSSKEVKLFFDGKTKDPAYNVTTDWGALDGYHAPERFPKNNSLNIAPNEWTLDVVESPRNNPWFLRVLNARRALTFLEQQEEVDGTRLGVYGHSMGGKQTVLTAGADSRVKAAVPSCGGVSDRTKGEGVYLDTINDDVSLKHISCPILFQSPSNDFHGRIDDLQKAVTEIQTKDWRVTCAPHHNHQDTADYEVVSQLWFDQYLKGSFEFPQTPEIAVNLKAKEGVPVAQLKVDTSKPILSVDFYYTRQGQMDGLQDDRSNTVNRFWHHAEGVAQGQIWKAELPLNGLDKPLWVYANVRYALEQPVSYAGYYYRVGSSESFVLSSLLYSATPAELEAAGVRSTEERSLMIEDFASGWQNEWFTYRPSEWARSTHKIYDPRWKAPKGAKLNLQVSAAEANKFVVLLDDYGTEVELEGGSAWEALSFSPSDFKNVEGESLETFDGVKELKLSPQESLRGGRGSSASRKLGATWKGPSPVFNDLHWSLPEGTEEQSVGKDLGKKETLQQGLPDTFWTYKEVEGKALKLSVFLPEGYESSEEKYPCFVVFHGGSWKTGEASWHYPDCSYWSQRGMIAVSVDYRLSARDGVEVPLECVKDAKSAIRYLRKNADELKVDPNKLVAAGGSAGGQLAVALATLKSPDTNDESYDLAISCVPDAVIAYNPYYKCEASLSPPNFVTEGLPPLITFVGDKDPAVTVESLVAFQDDYRDKGNSSELYVGIGGKHGLCNGRNPKNRFFYWSLELADQFLVSEGVIQGKSLVKIQDDVKVLEESDYKRY